MALGIVAEQERDLIGACQYPVFAHADDRERLRAGASGARSRSAPSRTSSGWNDPGAVCTQSFVPATLLTNFGSPASACSLK